MYKSIGQSEINSLQTGLRFLISAKKFTYDKNFVSFAQNKLPLDLSIDYYINALNETYIPYSIDSSMLNTLKEHNIITSSHYKFIVESTITAFSDEEDEWDYDVAQDKTVEVLDFILGFWNKTTSTKAILWDLESLGNSEDCEEVENYFLQLRNSIRNYICYDEYLEEYEKDKGSVDYYEWYNTYAGENGNIYCFPGLHVEAHILDKINKLLPNYCCQVATEAWCEFDNFYITIADSSMIEGLDIRLITILLAIIAKEATNV